MNAISLVCLLALAFSASAGQIRGPVEGISDCGSSGELLEIRVEDCTVSPCNMEPGRDYEVEVDFVASEDSDALNWKVIVTLGIGGWPIADLPINGTIVAGESYTLRHALPVHDTLAGVTVRVKFEITDVATSRMEICAMAEASIQHPEP